MQGKWIRRPQDEASAVFVHGILSSGETRWRNDNGCYWPELLKNEPKLQSLGIYVFTYETGIFSGSYRLSDIVDALKEHMRLDGVPASDRLVFICHSMGGIVVRKFIVERAAELIGAEKEIYLFLVASPSLGSTYANWLSPLAQLFGHAQADALRFVRNNNWLMDLDKEFMNLKEGGTLKIKGKELVEDKFIELKKIKLGIVWRRQVVEAFSGARYFGEPFKVPASDHFSIAQPIDKDAVQHRLLCQFILKAAARLLPVSEVSASDAKPQAALPDAPCIELDWPHISPHDAELQAFLAEAGYRMARGDSPCCQVTLSSMTAAEKAVADIDCEPTPSPQDRTKRIEQLQTIDHLRRIRTLLERAIEFVVSDEHRKKAGW